MKTELKHQIGSLLITTIILILFEIISTAVLPALGLKSYMIPFHILIILYLGFKVHSSFLGLFVLFIQFFHSFFSVEGWEMGTIAGVLICILIGYLKELLHFSSAFITILTTQIFQVFWFLIMAGMLYIKIGDFSFIVGKFYRFIPESIIISLCAPVLFMILDKIWRVSSKEGMLGEEV